MGTAKMKLYLTPLLFTFASAAVPAFIKFFAPWCGHCKAMAADWEKLADEWADSDVGLVAEVDCTNEDNTPICGGVQGYPTIKYGDPNSLQDYQGGREYDELAAFAKDNLKPVCSPTQLENCTDEEKAELAKYEKMSVEELEKAISDVDEAMAEAEKNFEAEVDKLQQKYDELMKGVEVKSAALQKESGYKWLKTVLASKAPAAPEGEEGGTLGK